MPQPFPQNDIELGVSHHTHGSFAQVFGGRRTWHVKKNLGFTGISLAVDAPACTCTWQIVG